MKRIYIGTGNIFKAKESYIVCPVSCCGNKNTNTSFEIFNQYPEVYRRYQNYCREHSVNDLFGRMLLIPTDDGKVICALFTQRLHGNNKSSSVDKIIARQFKQLDKIVPIYERIAILDSVWDGSENFVNRDINLIRTQFKRHDVVLYKNKYGRSYASSSN